MCLPPKKCYICITAFDRNCRKGIIFPVESRENKGGNLRINKNINIKIDQQPRQTELQTVIKPSRREGETSQSRLDRIEDQRAKEREHSDFEKSQRMHKQQVLRSTRLSEQRVPLAQKDPKHRMENYDLDQKRRVSIQTSEAIKTASLSKSDRDIDIKRDIKKAIIYSEILGKPKSLQRK